MIVPKWNLVSLCNEVVNGLNDLIGYEYWKYQIQVDEQIMKSRQQINIHEHIMMMIDWNRHIQITKSECYLIIRLGGWVILV